MSKSVMLPRVRLALLVFSIGMVGFCFWLFLPKSPVSYAQRGGGGPTKVKTMLAKVQAIQITGEALGTTRAYEAITITARINETIDRFHFEEGQSVKKGDLLISFTKDEEEAQKDGIQAQLKENQREVNRLDRLVKKGAAPQSQLDARLTELAKSQAALREIEAKIKDRVIEAPFDGIIGIRNFSVGALVQAGAIITTLDTIDPMKLDMTVPATYLTRLKIGMPLIASSDVFRDNTFEGTISHIDTRIDPVSRSLKVRADLPNKELVLKPGLFMNVDIITDERNAIMIPEIAVIYRQDKQYLYLVDQEQKVKEQEVKLGARIDGQVEILSGINAGDQVIVEGTIKVSPGSPVEIAESSEKNSAS